MLYLIYLSLTTVVQCANICNMLRYRLIKISIFKNPLYFSNTLMQLSRCFVGSPCFHTVSRNSHSRKYTEVDYIEEAIIQTYSVPMSALSRHGSRQGRYSIRGCSHWIWTQSAFRKLQTVGLSVACQLR